MVLPACDHVQPPVRRLQDADAARAAQPATPQSAAAPSRSSFSRMTARSFIRTAACRELALGETLLVDRIRHAFGWALAVPVLWVSTLVCPVMGLAYVLALGVIDTIGHV